MQLYDKFRPTYAGTPYNDAQPSTWTPGPPHAAHKPLALWSGRLLTLSGKQHAKLLKRKDGAKGVALHVLLTHEFLPLERVFTNGVIYNSVPQIVASPMIYFPMADMMAPDFTEDLQLVVDTMRGVLESGGTVALSCHGGHGRTGTLATLLWGLANPDDTDPIETVRSLVCTQEVESTRQEDFIHDYLNLPRKERPKYTPLQQKPSEASDTLWTHDREGDWAGFIREFNDEIERRRRLAASENNASEPKNPR